MARPRAPLGDAAAAREELARWWTLAWPSALTSGFDLLPWIVSLTLIGRLGTEDLSAVSLMETWLYGWMVVALGGVVSTQHTLCSQARGANNVGALRGWSAMTLAAMLASDVVVVAMWVAAPAVLRGVGFDAALVDRGAVYSRLGIPAMVLIGASAVGEVHLSAMQAPGVSLGITVLCSAIDAGLSYYFILGITPSLGLAGGAAAWDLGEAIKACLFALAMRWALGKELLFNESKSDEDDREEGQGGEEGVGSGAGAAAAEGAAGAKEEVIVAAAAGSKAGDSNDEEGEGDEGEDEDEDEGEGEGEGEGPGGSRSCWGPVLRFLASGRRWRTFLQQCLPNLGTSALSTLQWTTISFLAAGIGALQIAAHNGAMALNEVVHALTNGMAEATSIRVGFHLGRGDAVGAQRAAALGLGMAALLGATVAVPGYFARAYLGRIFSDDPAVVAAVESIATWFWISNYLECVCATAWAVLEGQGRASANTYVAFFCDRCVGMVLAVLSTRFTSYGLSGLWGGVAIGSAVALVVAVALILASDWPRLVEDARARLEEEEREDREAAGKKRRARAAERARLGGGSAGDSSSAAQPLLGE